jgi:N6-L-threonylcarbamoyladenine synthase
MNILGIESSCDETAAAVVRDGKQVLSSVISSQIKVHAAYGGVIPELAAREHLRAITPVVDQALHESGCSLDEIDAVAVTQCPGLVPALLVGASYAKGLAATRNLPLVGINHFLAHVYGAFLDEPQALQEPAAYPILSLVVSGGHTALFAIQADGSAAIVGRTLDDAAGEAFDKAAKILHLGYPGGPVIDRLAKEGNPTACQFPRGLMGGGGRPAKREHRFNFSFSGVKTALLYHVQDREVSDAELKDVVASYQQAVVDVLVLKTLLAAKELGAPTIVLSGGVACNSRLRADMAAALQGSGQRLVLAPPKYCTDNAAMVAGLAYHSMRHGQTAGLNLGIQARLPEDLGSVPFAPLLALSRVRGISDGAGVFPGRWRRGSRSGLGRDT